MGPDLREMLGVEVKDGAEDGVDEGVPELMGVSWDGSGVALGSRLNSDSDDTRAKGLIHIDMSA